MNQHVKTPLPISPPSAPAAPDPDQLGEHDGVVFQRERLAPCLRELLRLIEADWQENGLDHATIPLNLNIEQYLQYDLLGILQIVTARDDGILVGFIFAFVHPHIMHAKLGWCLINLYYLFPEYRRRGIGRAMFEALERFLVDAHVTVVEASEKIGNRHGLFERMGYKETDVALRKYLA